MEKILLHMEALRAELGISKEDWLKMRRNASKIFQIHTFHEPGSNSKSWHSISCVDKELMYDEANFFLKSKTNL